MRIEQQNLLTVILLGINICYNVTLILPALKSSGVIRGVLFVATFTVCFIQVVHFVRLPTCKTDFNPR